MAGSKDEEYDIRTEARRFWDHLTYLSDNHPEDYDRMITKELKDGKELFTPPEPCFCLRMDIVPMHNCSKLYLNVCKWLRIPKPASDYVPVPVKGGVLRYKMDETTRRKTGGLIYDVAFNPEVLDECKGSLEIEGMLIQLCFKYVEDCAKVKLLDNELYTKLKKKFVGPQSEIQYSIDENWKQYLPQDCRVDFGDSILKEIGRMKTRSDVQETAETDLPPLKLHPDPLSHPSNVSTTQPTTTNQLIQEISTESNASYTEDNHGTSKVCVPKYTLSVKEADEKQSRRVCARVCLPGVASVREIELDVSKDTLSLVVAGKYELIVKLPVQVDEDSTKASYKTKIATLTVTMPCL